MKTAAVAFLAMFGLSGIAHAQQYDLVINNGRVMDPETMFDSIANVGIRDGRIQAITKQKITGNETIDATGLVVAPGFIDTHFHSVDVFATKMAVRDGVTTGMDLEQGAARVGAWYAAKEKEGWQTNFGTTSSLLFTRLIVHDPEVKFDGPADMVNGSGRVNAGGGDIHRRRPRPLSPAAIAGLGPAIHASACSVSSRWKVDPRIRSAVDSGAETENGPRFRAARFVSSAWKAAG